MATAGISRGLARSGAAPWICWWAATMAPWSFGASAMRPGRDEIRGGSPKTVVFLLAPLQNKQRGTCRQGIKDGKAGRMECFCWRF